MKRQTGTILAFCLIFLALLAVMAIAGMESILLHERMAANMRLSRDGFAAAEAALRESEADLGRQCPEVGAAFSANLPATDSIWRQTAETGRDWWELNGREAFIPGAEPGSIRFFVESWRDASIAPAEPAPVFYRITARGAASGNTGASILQVIGVVICDAAQPMAQSRLSWRQLI